jgi:predicted CopG family antitoxin
MATKTISLEMDAYEKLRRARRTPSESFSSVVRRAEFPGAPKTGADVLAIIEKRMKSRNFPMSEADLDFLDEAQKKARASNSEWENE